MAGLFFGAPKGTRNRKKGVPESASTFGEKEAQRCKRSVPSEFNPTKLETRSRRLLRRRIRTLLRPHKQGFSRKTESGIETNNNGLLPTEL